MDRLSVLESWRRSLGMANPNSPALTREEGMALIAEVQQVRRQLWRLRYELRRLLDDEV